MLYLAVHFAWFLLAAFAMGLVFGWLSCRGGLRGLASAPSLLLLLAWAGAAALVWGRVVNDRPAFWIETGLLYLGVYVAGCLVGGLVAAAGGQSGLAPALALPSPRLALPKPMAALPPPGPATAAAASLGEALPPVEGQETIQGVRPAGFGAARGGKPDDLELISGIGPQNAQRLNALGIWHFSQIAAWSQENIDWVGSYLAFPGRIEREDWVAQARELAKTVPADASAPEAGTAMTGAALDGTRPAGLLTAPRGGQGDDLLLIDGVGPGLAEKLNALGIWHFDQLTGLSAEEMRFVAHQIGLPGREALLAQWRDEAKSLAEGGETEHSRAVKARRGKD
ncbi:hypothetical protein ABE438_08075 [Bosea sp. TWI1241]|uniref:hypothetical protein n=1 Tax=Bosea sp. TWI1241 TaxID=3148904 RepID=UPI0032086905